MLEFLKTVRMAPRKGQLTWNDHSFSEHNSPVDDGANYVERVQLERNLTLA